jgi:hypothetical protein
MRFWQAAEARRSSPGVYLVYLWKIDAGAPGRRVSASNRDLSGAWHGTSQLELG